MSADAESRRARRAREMVFAKAKTFAEHEAQGIAFWKQVDPGLKFQAIVELVQDSCYLSGGDGAGSGPARFAHGAQKLRG